MGLHARGPGHLPVLLRWVGARRSRSTCAVALATPAAPDHLPDRARGVNDARLGVPAHLLERAWACSAALGAILLTHLTASEREPAAVRVAAAAGAAGRRGDALLHVLARRDRRRRRRRRPLHGARAPARAARRAARGGLPVAFALQPRVRRGAARPRVLRRAPARASRGRMLLVVGARGACVAAAVLRVLALRARPAAGRGSGSAARARRARSGPRRSRGARARGRRRRVRPARPRRRRSASEFVARRRRRRTAATCATRLTDVGNNGRLDTGEVALDAAERDPGGGRAPARTGCTGSATGRAAVQGRRRPLALLRDRAPSSAGSASLLLAVALGDPARGRRRAAAAARAARLRGLPRRRASRC